MIRVDRHPAPKNFERDVQEPGLRWLENPNNRTKPRPRDYWKHCRDDLERQFESRCGYAATWISSGYTDHFVSWSRCKSCNEHHRAYEWENLRWMAPELNSLKSDHEILDPFEVQDSWFDIHLPSLRLRMTDAIPVEHRGTAERTLQVLKLESGPLVRKWRQAELRLFANGTSLSEIMHRTPLLGRALEQLFAASPEDLEPEQLRFRTDLEARRRHAATQHQAPPRRP
ncbi:hypothetical protein [Paraliomyxa miuraensis]|uniref:hypothetical protein n=1 Tax=Paraliomyxa miuraensis TaxID=376150 RepID=UPI002250FDFB|nr:hypothetical protein [Paraliomyxa miuraensis]MCX4241607.1 hypothetical protein [Paraliomyxa miuraensis]